MITGTGISRGSGALPLFSLSWASGLHWAGTQPWGPRAGTPAGPWLVLRVRRADRWLRKGPPQSLPGREGAAFLRRSLLALVLAGAWGQSQKTLPGVCRLSLLRRPLEVVRAHPPCLVSSRSLTEKAGIVQFLDLVACGQPAPPPPGLILFPFLPAPGSASYPLLGSSADIPLLPSP